MKLFSNKLLLTLMVVFLSSCAPSSSNVGLDKNSLLIEPESFIADMQEKVILTSEAGPVLADIYEIPSEIKRNQIYKEEKTNYISVKTNDVTIEQNDIVELTE